MTIDNDRFREVYKKALAYAYRLAQTTPAIDSRDIVHTVVCEFYRKNKESRLLSAATFKASIRYRFLDAVKKEKRYREVLREKQYLASR